MVARPMPVTSSGGPGATPVASLPPFAHDWVGGNIHGLSQLAGILFAYVPEMTGVASALDSQVQRIVGAAGWQGSAASAFSSAWQKDSAAARAVAVITEQVGIIVDWLAVHLAHIEYVLEEAADEAGRHGVPIGPDGVPEAACQTAAEQKWLDAYTKLWKGSMLAAEAVRQEATVGLVSNCQQATQGSGALSKGSDAVTVGDLLADLLAAPSSWASQVETAVKAVSNNVASEMMDFVRGHSFSEAALREEMAAWYGEIDRPLSQLDAAQSAESPLSKLLNYPMKNAAAHVQGAVSRLAGNSSEGGEADEAASTGDAADGGGMLGTIMKFGGEIPVVDIAAGLAGTGLGTAIAVSQGHSVLPAVAEQTVSNATSLGAGAWTARALGNAGTMIGGEVGGDVGTAAGPSGVVVGVGVGDTINNLYSQNWSGDIHACGVLGGSRYAFNHAVAQTGEQFASYGDGVWNGVTRPFRSAWDALTHLQDDFPEW